jgi:hypothetical protein
MNFNIEQNKLSYIPHVTDKFINKLKEETGISCTMELIGHYIIHQTKSDFMKYMKSIFPSYKHYKKIISKCHDFISKRYREYFIRSSQEIKIIFIENDLLLSIFFLYTGNIDEFNKYITHRNQYKYGNYYYNLCERIAIEFLSSFITLEKLLNDDDYPDEFCDPISFMKINDPIMIPDINYFFDISSITQHLNNNNTNPYTRKPLYLFDVYEYNNRPEIIYKVLEFKNKMFEYEKSIVVNNKQSKSCLIC